MAPKKVNPAYVATSSVDMPLPFQEDHTLSVMPEYDATNIVKPPGIQTLRQWGEEVLAGGKHVGKTFAEARAIDASYAHFMVKKGDCTSAWAKSFHNYLKAMENVTDSHPADQRPVMTSSTAAMVKKNWAMNGAIATDWDVVDELRSQQSAEVPKGITSLASGSGAKRGPPVSSDPWAMQTEMSYEASLRVQQIQAQIAILQDEMNRLVPSAEEEA